MQIFEKQPVRAIWDEENEKWWFSVVDVVAVLTDSDYQKARKYWKVLKGRLAKEGNESVTNCYQLKMQAADYKKYLTDVADTEQVLRLIQSIPSKKAEPFKMWLAKVGNERIDESIDPELSINRAQRHSRPHRHSREGGNPDGRREHQPLGFRQKITYRFRHSRAGGNLEKQVSPFTSRFPPPRE